jgi:hypothetical protein
VARPSSVKTIKRRTWGSKTLLREEVSLPSVLYHGFRPLGFLWRHPYAGTGTALYVGLLILTGSWAWAAVAELVLAAACLTGYVALGRRRAGGAAFFSTRDAVTQLRHKQTLLGQWPLACETAGLIGPNKGGHPKLHRVTAQGDGTFRATVSSGRMGVPVPAIQKQTDTLAEVIGCHEVEVTKTGPGVASLQFHWNDPVGRVLPLTHLPAPPKGQLAYGIRQDGSPASILLDKSLLIGGMTGMGKSNTIWALLADAIRQDIPLALYVSDPKGGIELGALKEHVGVKGGLIEVRQYVTRVDETDKMVRAMHSALLCRQRWMEERRMRKVSPSRENPACILILDEVLLVTKLVKDGTDSPIGQITLAGRAAGYAVWGATQIGQKENLGPWRDLITQRICYATSNVETTDSILGSRAEANGGRCSALQKPGVGYSYDDDIKVPRKFRAAYVSDEDTKLIAAGMVPDRMFEVEREAAGHTALYRWYDLDDPVDPERPGYIGITYDALKREAEHNADLRDFMNKPNIRRTLEWFGSREAALEAEKKAIENEKPIFNDQHNRDNPNRVDDKPRRRQRKVSA